jgi:ubiquitin carboxyl-terminal hydrolase 8
MPEKGGLSTLVNLVNTCYMNSIIQVLRHTDYLNDFLDANEEDLNQEKATELYEWNSLRKLMWNSTKLISPKRWHACIQQSSKMGNFNNNYEQHDVSEYLIRLLDTFHLCLARPVKMKISGKTQNNNDVVASKCYKEFKFLYEKNYSNIIKLFYGIQVTNISSHDMNKIVSSKVEPFSIINLTIPIINDPNKPITLYDCLSEYCKDEILDGDNKWYNDITKQKENVTISTRFFELPSIIIISMKKYYNLSQFIHCPLDSLNLSKYMTYNTQEVLYDLYAVCDHTGTMDGGHYYSIIKHDNNWYKFNDTDVIRVYDNNVISSSTYCLFYKKKHNNIY